LLITGPRFSKELWYNLGVEDMRGFSGGLSRMSFGQKQNFKYGSKALLRIWRLCLLMLPIWCCVPLL